MSILFIIGEILFKQWIFLRNEELILVHIKEVNRVHQEKDVAVE